MILLPDKYNNISLTTEEKVFINSIKNKLDNNNIMLININTIQEAINNILIFKEGVSFIENIKIDSIENFKFMIPFIKQMHDIKINKIIKKLSNHRGLIDARNNINIKINYKYYSLKLSKDEILNRVTDKEIVNFINENFIFKSEVIKNFKDEKVIKDLLLYKNSNYNSEITQEKINIIINQLAPEYTIPIYKDSVDIVKHKDKNRSINFNYDIDDTTIDVKVLRLDSEQINIINNIKPGSKLILACAGSGKSVLLISKCFKVASMHESDDINKNKRVLLTCFNKNLNDMYNWRINIGGFRERNVDSVTFHKLCMDLLNEVNIPYGQADFDEVFEIARNKLKDGTIKRRYYGIFIDEVQIFKPEWYEFCYDLLEDKENNSGFFVICGDKSQTIANNVKHGRAPWQGNDRLPNFKGNSIRLEKNYRNTIQVNSYINRFTEVAKSYAQKYNIEFREDTDYILRGKAFRQGREPIVIRSDRCKEAQNVVDIIKDLNKNKEIDLSDIAVLFCQRRYDPRKYYINNWVINKLVENNIEYTDLSPQDGMDRTSYGYREGVTLCTVNSALGLDFKAVIICGIYPVGLYNKTCTDKSLKKLDEEKIEDFRKNINMLYTACTRARDELIIVTTDEESIYSKMLVEASEH